MQFRNILMVLAAASMLPLSACSQSGSGESSSTASDGRDTQAGGSPSAAPGGALTIPEDADPVTKKIYLAENATAACMKKRGFSYTPNPGPTENEASSAIDGADYALAKKYRQKYGFGIYSSAVYPNDPAAPGTSEKGNPNASYRSSLPAAQQKAYDKALGRPARVALDNAESNRPAKGSCIAEANLKVYGPAKSAAEQDRENAKQAERDRQAGQALNGDQQLVLLAQEYASCLRKDGITVSTTQPTSIGEMVKFQVSAQIPADGTLSKEDAMPKLTREIGLALKDLECGKKFRAAYWPKYKKNPYVGGNG